MATFWISVAARLYRSPKRTLKLYLHYYSPPSFGTRLRRNAKFAERLLSLELSDLRQNRKYGDRTLITVHDKHENVFNHNKRARNVFELLILSEVKWFNQTGKREMASHFYVLEIIIACRAS